MAKMWILFRSIDSVARSLGGPWTWWIGFAPVQLSGCCLGAALSWLRDGLMRGLVILHWPFVSREQSTWSFSGLDSCVLAYCGSAAPRLLSLQSFCNYARGHCEAARNFFRDMHSVHLISVEQCFRKWVQWSPCIGGAKCGLIASNERDVQSFLRLQRLLARSLPRRYGRSRRACARLNVHFVCVCVYMCMCVCVRTCKYVYIRMYVCICTFTRLYTCVCVCVCIFVQCA